MDAKLRDQVKQRAGNRCEYCGLRQEHDSFHSFHVEHIVARQHGGKDDPENLAWSCHQCNLRKGGLDPDTSQMVPSSVATISLIAFRLQRFNGFGESSYWFPEFSEFSVASAWAN